MSTEEVNNLISLVADTAFSIAGGIIIDKSKSTDYRLQIIP